MLTCILKVLETTDQKHTKGYEERCLIRQYKTMQIFKIVLFFKLCTSQKQAMKGTPYLLFIGRIRPFAVNSVSDFSEMTGRTFIFCRYFVGFIQTAENALSWWIRKAL